MKASKIYIPFILLMLAPSLKAQIYFSEKEKSVIYSDALLVLSNYQSLINQMGEFVVSDIEKARGGAEGLLELFVKRQVLIFNDLDPAHKLSEFYEAETYTNSIILWYPDGITISLDLNNARVSEIMSHENNIYSIDILTKKTINGNYLNQTLNQNVEELLFRIAFSVENKSAVNFKIVGIRNAASGTAIDYSQALREVNAEDISEEDIAMIQNSIKEVLRDYTNFLSLIGDPQEAAEEKNFYKESFTGLFTSGDIRVYNDIAPEPETNLISVSDYLVSYVEGYPEGIKNLSINADSAKFGQVMKAEDGSFYTYTRASKFFSGNFRGRDVFRNSFQLVFKITFKSAENIFTDFKINSIDRSETDYLQAAAETGPAELPQVIIRPVTRKGLSLSFIGSFGMTSITNRNIESLTILKDSVSWTLKPLSGFITALGVTYYFNDNIAVRSGLEFNTYSAKYNLAGKFGSKTKAADLNSDEFYKRISADYDSLININYITLPLLINYTSGKPGKLGFFAEGGAKISIPQKAQYNCTGYYIYTGYYPDNPAVLQVLDIEELGFYRRENIDITDKVKIKGFNLALYASAGINIPLGYYSSITFGPEAVIGITDIAGENKKYMDIFGVEHEHLATKIKNFGLRISLAYKL